MACYHPLKAYRTPDGVVFTQLGRYDIVGDIELPCGQCIACRMRRASDWALRVMQESTLWDSNCFITLTYARDCLPAGGSLEHRDFQLFMKRLRKQQKGKTIRFYMCGEYGPLNGRPHYHACIFNNDFRKDRTLSGVSASGANYYDSQELRELWTHGKVSVQDLTLETAGYCARYIMKKALGKNSKESYDLVDAETGEITHRNPEYAAMSLKPGIGAEWFNKFHTDVYPVDYVIASGTKYRPPKYYDKLFKRSKDLVFDQVEQERIEKGKLTAPDQTDERRAVRERVHNARVRDLTRKDL